MATRVLTEWLDDALEMGAVRNGGSGMSAKEKPESAGVQVVSIGHTHTTWRCLECWELEQDRARRHRHEADSRMAEFSKPNQIAPDCPRCQARAMVTK